MCAGRGLWVKSSGVCRYRKAVMAPKKAVVVTPEPDVAPAALPVDGRKPKAGPASGKAKVKRRLSKVVKPTGHPPTLSMVVEVLKKNTERKGTSVPAIRNRILSAHPTVDPVRLKFLLRTALNKGIEKGILVRPLNSSATGATGRFKLAKVGKKPKEETNGEMLENEDPNVEAAKPKKKPVKKTKAAKAEEKPETAAKAATKKTKDDTEKPKPAAKAKKDSDPEKAAAAPAKKSKAKADAPEAEDDGKAKKPPAKKVPAKKAQKENPKETKDQEETTTTKTKKGKK